MKKMQTHQAPQGRWLGRKLPNKWVTVAVASIATGGVLAGTMIADATDKNGNPQKVGEAGIALIEEFEGYELDGYLLGDGMCTIGIGHAVPLSQMSEAECKKWSITEEEADTFLREDVERFADKLNEYFCRPFTQNQFDALVSFSYNVGYAYEKYDWDCAPPDDYFPGIMIQYTNPPQYKEGLTRRRKAEIALFEDPVDRDPVIEVVEPRRAAIAPQTFEEEVATPVEIPTYYVPAGEATPTPVETFPAIPPLFKGAFGER